MKAAVLKSKPTICVIRLTDSKVSKSKAVDQEEDMVIVEALIKEHKSMRMTYSIYKAKSALVIY
jgi:hypothetical protein